MIERELDEVLVSIMDINIGGMGLWTRSGRLKRMVVQGREE